MYCTRCGIQLDEQHRFCFTCGTPTGRGPVPMPARRLTRSITDKKIAGVCGGFAEHLAADPVIVRILWVVLSLGLPPAGIFGYIIAWIIIPKAEPVAMTYAPPASSVPVT